MTTDYLPRVIALVLVMGIIQILVDWYVLAAWKRYVQHRGWAAWLYRVPITLAAVMLPMMAVTTWMRQTQINPTPLNRALHYALAVWYFPKVLIALSLISYRLFLVMEKRVLKPLLWRVPSLLELIRNVTARCFNAVHTACRTLYHTLAKRISFLPIRPSTPIVNADTLLDTPTDAPTDMLPNALRASTNSVNIITSPSRRAFLTTLVNAGHVAAASVPIAAITYDAVRLLDEFEVHRVEIPIAGLPRQFEGMTITQISDIHAGSYYSTAPLQEMRRIIRDLRSDLTLITGDWVNFRARELPFILPEIQKLTAAKTAPMGVFGSLGNHDHYAHALDMDDLKAMIRGAEVNLLINQHHVFEVDGARLQLGGNDNVGLRQSYGKLSQTLQGLSAEHPTIVMAHDPTLWDKEIRRDPRTTLPGDIRIDLTLSGHTHGGQFGVRVMGVEITPAALIYKQYAGLYTDEATGQHIYVNRGIGTTGIPVRIGVPPEITHITLRKA
jgi:predicted MPP superfamily phosphohydrolase